MTELTLPAVPRTDTEIDPLVPNLARMYDFYLGGDYNFPADREKARLVEAVLPSNSMLARSNRGFLRRAVRHLAGLGVRQFLDLGSGIPTVANVHEVARSVIPDARVVYVDRCPVSVAQSELLLAGLSGIATIKADFREPDSILGHPRVRELLDFAEPVCVSMTGVLVFVREDERPGELVAAYRDACAPGSYLVISHLTDDLADAQTRTQVRDMVGVYASVNQELHVRDWATIASWFDGTELLEPGVSLLVDWRPDDDARVQAATPARALGFGGVGRMR